LKRKKKSRLFKDVLDYLVNDVKQSTSRMKTYS